MASESARVREGDWCGGFGEPIDCRALLRAWGLFGRVERLVRRFEGPMGEVGWDSDGWVGNVGLGVTNAVDGMVALKTSGRSTRI